MKLSCIKMSYIKLFETTAHAAQYAKYRPVPPSVLTSRIIQYLGEKLPAPHERAVDVGCGTGQSTKVLAPYFKEVVGIDISEAQIEEAQKQEKCSNVVYKVGSSENIPFPEASVALITVSQALHWLDLVAFYKEADRVLVPGGVLAAYCYGFPTPSGFPEAAEMKKEMSHLYEVETKGHWHPNRKIVDAFYKDIEMPYPQQIREDIYCDDKNWSVSDYVGYVQTWSGYQKIIDLDRTKAEQILNEFQKRVLKILGATSPDFQFDIKWHYALLMARKP